MSGDFIRRLTKEGDAEDQAPRPATRYFGSGVGDRVAELTEEGNRVDAGRDYWQPLDYFFARYTPGAMDARASSELTIACAQPGVDAHAVKEAVEKGWQKCESPIERVFLPWLVAQRYVYFDYRPKVLFAGEGSELANYELAIIPQLPIGRKRADFAIAARRGGVAKFVVVECDGAEFHDASKDAARDKNILNYDRVLAVVRLTGSDIMRDPKAAAEKAGHAVMRAWQKGGPQ